MLIASTSRYQGQQATQSPVKSEVREAWRKATVRKALANTRRALVCSVTSATRMIVRDNRVAPSTICWGPRGGGEHVHQPTARTARQCCYRLDLHESWELRAL